MEWFGSGALSTAVDKRCPLVTPRRLQGLAAPLLRRSFRFLSCGPVGEDEDAVRADLLRVHELHGLRLFRVREEMLTFAHDDREDHRAVLVDEIVFHQHPRREIDRAGSRWRENGLVFASEIGTPSTATTSRSVHSDRYSQTVTRRPLLAKAELPQIRFHDLRHTSTTILLSKGVHAKFVQEMLGHATIAITLDTYSHVLLGMSDSLANAMDEALC